MISLHFMHFQGISAERSRGRRTHCTLDMRALTSWAQCKTAWCGNMCLWHILGALGAGDYLDTNTEISGSANACCSASIYVPNSENESCRINILNFTFMQKIIFCFYIAVVFLIPSETYYTNIHTLMRGKNSLLVMG